MRGEGDVLLLKSSVRVVFACLGVRLYYNKSRKCIKHYEHR